MLPGILGVAGALGGRRNGAGTYDVSASLNAVMGVVPAGSGGWTTIFLQSLSASSSGWPGYNIRQIINSALLISSGSTVRLTFEGTCTIDGAYIGHQAASGDVYDFDGGQAQIKVGGSSSFTLSGTPVVTDPITFSLDHTKNLIIAAHFPTGGIAAIGQTSATIANASETFKFASDETSVSDASGYTIGANVVSLVSLIEGQ